MLWAIVAVSMLAIAFIDVKLDLLAKKWSALPLLTVLAHPVALYALAFRFLAAPAPAAFGAIALSSWFLLRLAFYAPKPKKIPLGMRLRIMEGGRRIFLAALASSALQIPLCVFIALARTQAGLSAGQAIADILAASLLCAGFMVNGALRIVFTSKRLGVLMRVVFALFGWIPGVNLALGLRFCEIAKQEYVFEYLKEELQQARADSQDCRTRYPLLLLHGIGFRDYKYLNYWGRIPLLLTRNGATVRYGKQQAWGTIESNAQEIKEQALSILAETGCEKVNIIAHSKGGLDARHMISALGMADSVASLTTISTPHRGSELLKVLAKIKEPAYRKICGKIDEAYRKMGDKAPDTYTAGKQLSPEFCQEFNRRTPDAPGIYYQSYASEMKKASSHALLSLPFAVMKIMAGGNDGLVTVESARWGEFKGSFKSRETRGISHGDQIDLMRKDYEGFNMPEEYVAIVKDLKERGY
jgi:triacylglycerol lipase